MTFCHDVLKNFLCKKNKNELETLLFVIHDEVTILPDYSMTLSLSFPSINNTAEGLPSSLSYPHLLYCIRVSTT